MASPISFQGLSSGIQTDALVSAILAQEGRGVDALKARQDRNKLRATALNSLKTNMTSLSLSLAALQDKFNARTVTSNDTNNAYVTATASGAATGSYDIKVSTLATKGQLSPTQGVTLSVADPSAAIFSSPKASFAVQGTDGVIKAFEVTNNSLNGLRDAINASGAGVTATVVNSGSGTNPYQLVITAKETGTGSTAGIVKFAAIDNADSSATTLVSNAGVTLGSLAGSVTGTFATPTGITGGLSSSVAATDAQFTVNGISLTRKSNVVTDAAAGVTFTLKQGGQTGSTTLTVAQDKAAATAGMQDVVTKFNAMLKTYKDGATTIKNADGSINQGPLSGDSGTLAMISQIRNTLLGSSAGLSGSSAFQNAASLGIKTLSDGTLSLDSTVFQAAIDKDPAAAKRLFAFSGDSTNGAVSVQSGTSKTATGTVTFTIDSYTAGGAVSGTFTGTPNGPITLSGTNGVLNGTGDLDGLSLAVTGLGSGTLTLSRGAGQAARDLITNLTSTGTGSIATTLTNLDAQNRTLTTQIDAGQSALARRKKVLQAQFSKMEVAIAQMRASAGSLSGA